MKLLVDQQLILLIIAPEFDEPTQMDLLVQLLSNETIMHEGIQLVSNIGSLVECHVFEEVDPQKILEILSEWTKHNITY